MSSHDEETDDEYKARMEAMIREADLHTAKVIDELNFIEYAAKTAIRENRFLIDYLPEDHPLRFYEPDHFQRMGEALDEAARTGRPLADCMNERLKPGEPRW